MNTPTYTQYTTLTQIVFIMLPSMIVRRELRSRNAIDTDVALDLDTFASVVSGEGELLLHRAVTGQLRVPDFESLTQIIKEVYEEVLPDKSGHNAEYIPQLARVNPDQFVSIPQLINYPFVFCCVRLAV